jgi:DNA-binding transcriptional ArsR family regulator
MLIEVSPADLAGCRYAISPLIETMAALRLATGHDPAGVLRPWVRRMRPRMATLRRDEPAVGALTSLFRRDDNADFIHPPPAGPHRSFADELAAVRATPLDQARAELARNLAGHRTPPDYARRMLAGADVVDRLADGIRAAWSVLVEPEWPRLRAVLERDIVQRAGRLAAYGWAAALTDLNPRVTWTAGGAIAVRHRLPGEYRLAGRGLLFVPSVFADLVLTVQAPRPFTLVYRARGIADVLGPPPVATAGDGLPALLGAARAAVLRALVAPATTSQLVAQLGLSLGTVGGHLAVLRDAGLVVRTRTGRSVQYVLTPAAEALAGAATTGRDGRAAR